MPAVAGPAPGGVTFHQARKLIHGLVSKGRVVGMDIVEITPPLDVNRISCDHGGPADRQPDRRRGARRLLRQAVQPEAGVMTVPRLR